MFIEIERDEKMIELAIEIAKVAHKEDRYGEKDYFEYHLMNVYRRVEAMVVDMPKEFAVAAKVVAILHDIHEDHDFPLDEIEMLFGKEIRDAVEAISFKKEVESREEYYERVLGNKIAIVVKRADASENMFNCELDGDKKDRVAYYDKIVKMMK